MLTRSFPGGYKILGGDSEQFLHFPPASILGGIKSTHQGLRNGSLEYDRFPLGWLIFRGKIVSFREDNPKKNIFPVHPGNPSLSEFFSSNSSISAKRCSAPSRLGVFWRPHGLGNKPRSVSGIFWRVEKERRGRRKYKGV